MIPLHLRISGFLSYREPVDLDFAGLDLACISGSNGAGKSSLLDAMTWALFGVARKKDDSLINSACGAAEVDFAFAYEGNVYRIQRSKIRDKTGILDFFIHTHPEDYLQNPGALPEDHSWRPLTEHSIRETEQSIRSTLRMDFDTFTNASFFLQGKADQFATQPPGDRKRILGSILGLEIWETYRQDAYERRRALEAECTTLDGRLHEINAELAEETDRKARLDDLETKLKQQSQVRLTQEKAVESLRQLKQALARQQEMVEKLKQQYLDSHTTLQTLENTLSSRKAECAAFRQQINRAAEIEAAYQAWQADRKELETWDGLYAQFREQEKERSRPLTEIEKARALLEQEKANLENSSRAAAADQARQAELRHTAVGLLETLSHSVELAAERIALDADIEYLRQQLSDARAENPRLMKEMKEIEARIKQLGEAVEAACPLCEQNLPHTSRQALIDRLRTEGTTLAVRWRENKRLNEEFETQNSALQVRQNTLTNREKEFALQQRQSDQIQHQLSLLGERLDAWEASGPPRLAEITNLLETGDYATEARRQLAGVDAKLVAMGYDPARHTAIRQRELAGRASEVQLRELESSRAALQPLEREIAGLEGQAGELGSKVKAQEGEYRTAQEAYEAAAAGAPDLEPAEMALREALEQENRLRMEVGAARQKVAILDVQRARKEKLNKQRDQLTHRIGLYKSLEKAFSKDGVPAMLIEQALPEIENHANEVLQRLSGGSMSVSFATQREYKDRSRDDRKETLDIRISDSSGIRDYEMFSGGEAFRVNFAIRLALSRVLANRAGARLQTLVIDEGFGSQDALGRQRLIEAINAVRSEFARILVITHMEELKDYFPHRIEVEKTDHGSTLHVM